MSAIDEAKRGSAEGLILALLILVGIFWTIATLWLANAKGDLGPVAAGAIRTPSLWPCAVSMISASTPASISAFRRRAMASVTFFSRVPRRPIAGAYGLPPV